MEQQKLRDKLKCELEALGGKRLTNSEAWEAYFNLSGFLTVLQKMRKEADNAKKV